MANIEEIEHNHNLNDNGEQHANVQVNNPNTRVQELKANKYGLSTLPQPLDDKNWAIWSKRITPILKVCKVYGYVKGTIPKPDPAIDPESSLNWETNDEYAKLLMLQNVAAEQIQHINQDQTASEVWKSLISLHQARGLRTALSRMRMFYSMRAAEDENIPDFMNKMKALVEDINSMKGIFKIDNLTYAGVLAQSLPPAWDFFMDKLFPGDYTDEDTIANFSIVQFQRQVKEEYYHRIGRKEDQALHGTHSNLSIKSKTPLTSRISGSGSTPSGSFCANCKKDNHTTDRCRHLGKPLCTTCNRFGHMTADCYDKNKRRHNDSDSNKSYDRRNNKRVKVKYQSNAAEDDEEVSAVFIEETGTSNTAPTTEVDNYGLLEPTDDVYYAENGNMTRSSYVECLADSGTTSHVFNCRDLFTEYRQIDNVYVGGVGGNRSRVHGKGTI